MIIRGCRYPAIAEALEKANQGFGNNLRFNNVEVITKNYLSYRVTLRVEDSRGPGAKIGHTGRHSIYACWHAHGTFFDSLPQGTTIIARGYRIRPGDEWQDYNEGSIISPYYASEACEC